jgi:hypothetical protein
VRLLAILVPLAALLFASTASAALHWHTRAGIGTQRRVSVAAPAVRTVPQPVNEPVSSTAIPLTAFGRIEVSTDPGFPYVFVSGGQGQSGIVVLDFAGNIVTTIPGETDATSMVAHGSTLYVARCNGSGIDTIDLSTLTVSGTLATGGVTGCYLAEAGGRLWFETDPLGLGTMTSISLSDGTRTPYPLLGYFGDFATGGRDGGLLVPMNHVLDISGGAPVDRGSFSVSGASSYTDETLSADGGSLFVATGGSPYVVSRFSTADPPTRVGTYPVGYYPNAVVVSPDGTHLATGRLDHHPDVQVYPIGATAPNRLYTIGPQYYGPFIEPRGLAFSPDGSKLFAVGSAASSGDPLVFDVLAGPELRESSLSLSVSSAVVTYNHAVTVTAHLTGHSTNRTVSIFRTPQGGSPQLVKSALIGPLGNVTASVVMKRNTTFVARYSGDASYASSASPERLVLARAVVTMAALRSYATVAGVHLYHAAVHPTFGGRVIPSHAGKCVRFHLERKSLGLWRDAGSSPCFRLSLRSSIVVSVSGIPHGHLYRIRMSFDGDVDHYGAWSKYAVFEITA